MKTIEIDSAVLVYREQQLAIAHRRVNAAAPRDQTPQMIKNEMAGVDALVELYRASFGAPDDQPGEQQDEPVSVVTPGVK